jgi:hypothetical protein
MKAVLLVLASTLLGLLLCEAGLRLFTQYGPGASTEEAPAGTTSPDKPLDLEGAAVYIAQLPSAAGTDRRWFSENPPPLPNRFTVSPQNVNRYRDYEKRGLIGPQADYIWNRRYVEANFCAPGSTFQNYPDKILVFDSPSGDTHPIYRFAPNNTTTAGLVTNQFGLRGPPLTLAKPPRTVRIAFVGASTTVNSHVFPFSYPERVTYWLNRFAEANHFDVRFEVLNAGREGINSEDIPAIVRYELLPLDPDLAVYYEGSNQFPTATLLVTPHVSPRRDIDPRDPVVQHKVPAPIRAHLAMGNLLDRALNGFSTIGEPQKPRYRLQWPAAVSERNPEVDSPYLPLQLSTIVRNLDSIRNSLASVGGQLVLCSFEWLVKDGMPLSPTRHQFIYKQLNTVLWPLRYSDIRRLADFQNRVFQRYATARNIPFVDVAALLPQDPNLFTDAIHMTDTGERVKAWIVFQQLAPLIRREIESGRLPRSSGSAVLPPPASMAASEISLGRCDEDPTGNPAHLEGALSIYRREASDGASIESGRPLRIVTPGQQWAYAASFSINMPPALTGRVYALVRARVLKGQIGVGVLDRGGNSFLVERKVVPSPAMTNIYLRLFSPDRSEALIFRNSSPDGTPSEILVEDVELVMYSEPSTH